MWPSVLDTPLHTTITLLMLFKQASINSINKIVDSTREKINYTSISSETKEIEGWGTFIVCIQSIDSI